ncbi:nuclear factor related to kappa-B-binding protein-like [Haliotis asinina]|uniref:nuclear factor related to kappa-B-binding protein-like n=1 Tax=Haliotis asinina TaxID=109174 RepID=UPI003531FB2A
MDSMDPEIDSDDGNWPEFQDSSVRTERCLFGREEVQLPEVFIEQSHIFKEVLSQEMWDTSLSDAQKQHLMKFLPKFPQKDTEEKEETVRRLFSGDEFKFGNPLTQFQSQLRDGFYSPDIARYTNLCKQYKYREYKFRQQRYYSALLKEVILTRQRVLEEVGQVPPEQPIKLKNTHAPPPKDKSLEHKVKKKYSRLLKEVREECEVDETSSDEEEEAVSPVQRSRRQLFKSLGPIPSPEPTTPSVLATFAAKPPVVNGDVAGENGSSVKRQRPISPMEVTEEDFRQMMRSHKRKKADNVELPELDTQNITLQDILSRCQANKKITAKASPSSSTTTAVTSAAPTTQTSPVLKKKIKGKDREEKKAKKKIKAESVDSGSVDERVASPSIQTANTGLEVHPDILTREDDTVPDFPLPDTGPSKLDNFFSLLRDVINEFPDQRVTTAKLEERIREWQESPSSSLNSWFPIQASWVDCVVSALKFLSGDVLGLSVDNFIPYLDYKERAQQWKWIGMGRDTETELAPLFQHWMRNKDNVMADGLDSSQGSPPPPRAKTAFVVRPTSQEEKATFQEQEKKRFENPHKAFIYHMHGYESVVGPVKGVYSKDNAMNKAREHALLVSDRPAFVTILTLVRDAAARLPNGEGTRGDICELLKDSQFLAPGVTDTQINTVVSGALDRLHSEKDPCVKYDVNRKLWIYLHRNRTEEEFERIHQAQGAAVKAKKSLQKPKTAKTIKDAISAQSAPRQTVSTNLATEAAAALNVEDLATLQSQALTSPSIVHSPKTLGQTTFARTPQSSPKMASPKNANLTLTSSSSLSVSLAQSPLKNTTHLLTSPTSLAQTSKPVGIPMVTATVPGAITAISQVKAETVGRKNQTVNLLQQQHLIRQGGAITAALANQQVGQNVTMTTKGEVVLQRPTSTSVTVAGAHQVPNTTKLISLAQVTTGIGTMTTPVSTVVSSMSGADSQAVARLIQQVQGGPQMLSVSNLLAAGGASTPRLQGANPRTTTIKIQGSSIVPPVGGKPIQISGKPLTHSKSLMQLGGKNQQSLGMIHTQQLSAISIIPQTITTCIATLSQPRSVVSSATSNTGVTEVSTSGQQHMTVGQPKMTIVGQVGPITSTQAQTVNMGGQPRVVNTSPGGIFVTHLAPGISLRPGLPGVGQAKMVSASQAGLAQLIMQQTPQGLKTAGGETVGVVPNVSQGTPLIVSNAGKGGQNIQVVRTVLSQQAGLKPGQATILISQPTLQQNPATMMSTSQVIHTTKSVRGSPKGKPQPVYARIITPPPGMKLTNVPQGTSVGASGVSVIQTVGKLVNSVTTATAHHPTVTTVTVATPPSTPLASVDIGDGTGKTDSGESKP